MKCLFGVVLAVSACSGGSVAQPEVTVSMTTAAPTTVAPTTTSTAAPPTTLSPEEQAEAELRDLAMAYLTYENNELEEGRTEPWPKLELLTGRLYDRVSAIRQEDLENDHYVVGSYEDPVIVSVDLDLAALSSRVDICTDDASRLVDAEGVELIGRRTGGSVLGYLLAVKVDGRWLLDELILEDDPCDPADYS